MTNCKHFSALLHNKQEPCLDGRENFMGGDVLPCYEQNVGTCEGHALREEDKPQEWQPASGKTQAEVIASSQRMFGDNPNKDK